MNTIIKSVIFVSFCGLNYSIIQSCMTKLLLYEKTRLSLSSISRFYAVIHSFGYIHTYIYPIVLSHAKRYTLLVSNRKCALGIIQ